MWFHIQWLMQTYIWNIKCCMNIVLYTLCWCLGLSKTCWENHVVYKKTKHFSYDTEINYIYMCFHFMGIMFSSFVKNVHENNLFFIVEDMICVWMITVLQIISFHLFLLYCRHDSFFKYRWVLLKPYTSTAGFLLSPDFLPKSYRTMRHVN